MVVLFIDTCNNYLGVGLAKDDKLVYKKEYDAFKRQSELLAKEVDDCLKENKVKPSDINKIVVTNGPGSYTGIRIGLTLAKVMATTLNIELVLISSLHAIAGKKENVLALIDARSKRAYYGVYDKGKCVKADSVDYIDNINIEGYTLIGDTQLFNRNTIEYSIIENMFELYKDIAPIKDPRSANAIYLKDAL